MKPIRFGSVCSGIEAASVAWHPLGWQTAWLAEIEPFPSAVLAHHYPGTPNLGDMTTIARRILTGEVEAPDVFAGGTPCQAFSVAGLRKSLDDARGNLSLKFVELADAIDHVRARRGDAECVVFWENVPGVLSTPDNAFGCFLAGLAGEDEPLQPPGKRWANAGCVYGPRRAVAWRTLDAQYFGVAQRRRRVFVVASARNGFDPAQVLFEWEGVRRDLAPRRSQAEDAAGTIAGGSRERGGYSHDDIPLAGTLGQRTCDHTSGLKSESDIVVPVSPTLRAGGNSTGGDRPPGTDVDTADSLIVTHSLRGEGFDASEDGTGRGTPLVPVQPLPFDTTQITSATNRCRPEVGDPCHPLAAGAHPPAIAFDCKASGQNGFGIGDIASTQRAMSHANSHTG
jgi:DNA (cytosine-5)-methyltransferase 1